MKVINTYIIKGCFTNPIIIDFKTSLYGNDVCTLYECEEDKWLLHTAKGAVELKHEKAMELLRSTHSQPAGAVH